MLSKLAVAVLFVIASGIVGPSACLAQRKTNEMTPESLQSGLELLKDQSDNQFVPVEYARMPPAIRSQADNYLAIYLTPQAQPQNDPDFKVRMFSTTDPSQNDLVEYRWTFSKLPLRAVQSLNALRLDILIGERSRTEDVKDLVGSIVKLEGTDLSGTEYQVRLRWPDTLADGVQFSSNPSMNIQHLLTWHDRIDAFVENGRLSIIIYKKISQLMTYQDGSQWFEKYAPKKASSD